MKTVKIFKLILGVAIVSLLAACAKPSSPWLSPPPDVEQSMNQLGGQPDLNPPRAEILFVIDNSASMKKHIADVSANIDVFVKAFSQNNPLEYNLAVTTVYDSRTYKSEVYKTKFNQAEGTTLPGAFLQIKDSANTFVKDKYFISSGDANIKDLLSNTLKVGVLDLEQGGPQYEESFSPIASAYGFGGEKLPAEIANRQKGFFLGADSYKIIFFVTDATDVSNFTASDLYNNLLMRSNGDASKIMAFGAIVPSNLNNCARDPGNKSYKLEDFLKLTNQDSRKSNAASLCESFGIKFAQFGKSIRERVLPKEILLINGKPVINNNPDETLRVFYGAQEIPFANAPGIIGFYYNPNRNSVVINPNFAYEYQPGAKFRVQYTKYVGTLRK